MIKKIQYLFLVAILSGCAIWGPNYSKPENAAPNKWRSEDAYTLMGAESLPEMAWWGKFHDPLLNQLVESALDSNNNIQSAVGNIYKARGILQRIKMNWVPTISAGAGYSTPNFLDYNTSSPDSSGGYSAGFIPSYSLNILQQLRTQEQANANLIASVAAKNAVRLAVISQVVGSYFSLRAEEYQLVLQKRLVKDLTDIVRIYSTAYKHGLISLYVLQQYEINLANAKATVPIIEYNIVNFQNTIHVLLNQNPGVIEPSIDFMQLASKNIIPGNLPSQVLNNRPDVIKAEQILKAANANIGVNTSVFFPSINLTTPLGYTSSALSGLFGNSQSYWTYQAGLNMPILNLGAYGAIKAAKGQYYADYFNYVETVKNAFASVDSSLTAHQKYTDSLDQMKKFYDSTNQRYKYQDSRFKEGLVNYPELLTLRVTLNQSGIMLAQSKLTQLNSIVKLYQDLGGGYMYKNNESAVDLGKGHRFEDFF